jgi:hypothetical protein
VIVSPSSHPEDDDLVSSTGRGTPSTESQNRQSCHVPNSWMQPVNYPNQQQLLGHTTTLLPDTLMDKPIANISGPLRASLSHGSSQLGRSKLPRSTIQLWLWSLIIEDRDGSIRFWLHQDDKANQLAFDCSNIVKHLELITYYSPHIRSVFRVSLRLGEYSSQILSSFETLNLVDTLAAKGTLPSDASFIEPNWPFDNSEPLT